ncbi:MAG: sulfotransferase family protein [Candidatus Hydrogenedentes bacterium]|nr:sulfotransferase family protein [Candidatus Hydrogenedentota bacterium]
MRFDPSKDIIVVSGLPRSGTSMMMKMLEAGGLPILSDAIRTADEDNPKGYYEFERVKKIKEDKGWIPEAVGKVVKIISFLMVQMPPEYQYRVVFLRRAIPEVLKSQRQMLVRRGENPDASNDERMTQLYEKHLAQAFAWFASQPNVEVLYIDHRRCVEEPRAVAEEVNAFLGGGLNVEAMSMVVDNSLYRQRA